MDKFGSPFRSGRIIKQGEAATTYQPGLCDGKGQAVVYSVLPGIELALLDIRSTHYHPGEGSSKAVLEINHCMRGRSECRMNDGCFQYVGEGELFMSTLDNLTERMELPLGYYKGIALTIDIAGAGSSLAGYLPGIPFSMDELVSRFFSGDECFHIQARDELRCIFSGMYTVPAEARPCYYRLKTLELLIYLHYFDPSTEKQQPDYARQQVETAKQVNKTITADPARRYTIDELARTHCISPTALKEYFKAVYGKSIAAYMKDYRMQVAAGLLRDTDRSVAEISAQVGYESQSKFSAAFKDVWGVTPNGFRRRMVR